MITSEEANVGWIGLFRTRRVPDVPAPCGGREAIDFVRQTAGDCTAPMTSVTPTPTTEEVAVASASLKAKSPSFLWGGGGGLLDQQLDRGFFGSNAASAAVCEPPRGICDFFYWTSKTESGNGRCDPASICFEPLRSWARGRRRGGGRWGVY